MRELMKRRRRNPQTRQPPQKSPARHLLRGALIDILENNWRASRLHRSRILGPSKTWPLGSSNGQESLAASSLDKYVKAVLHDDKKDPPSDCGSPKPRRSQTPDFEAPCQQKDSSPLSKGRNKELGTSVIGKNPWTRRGSDHNHHHQPFDFQIRGKQGGWKSVKVVPDSSLTYSLIREDTVHQLGISLNPMPPCGSPSIRTTLLGLVEPKWWAEAQIRTSPSTSSPVSINMVSMALLPGGSDMMIGWDLFKKLVGDMALTMDPRWASSSGLETSTSSIKDAATVSTSDDEGDADPSQGRPKDSTPQPDDKGSTLSELCDSELEFSSDFMDIGDESRMWCELLGGAYEAV